MQHAIHCLSRIEWHQIRCAVSSKLLDSKPGLAKALGSRAAEVNMRGAEGGLQEGEMERCVAAVISTR